jgi:hypothetical protein
VLREEQLGKRKSGKRKMASHVRVSRGQPKVKLAEMVHLKTSEGGSALEYLHNTSGLSDPNDDTK